MIHLTISSHQKFVVGQNFHPVLSIMPSAAALGGLATSVCIRAGIYIRLWEKDLKNRFKELHLRSAPSISATGLLVPVTAWETGLAAT